MFLLFFSDDQNLQMSKDKGTQTCMETGEKAKNVEFQYIYICWVIYKLQLRVNKTIMLMKQSFLIQTKEKTQYW